MPYRPRNVSLTFGPHVLRGFANKDFVSVTQDAESADVVKGAGGDVAIVIRDEDEIVTVKATFFAESKENRLLTQIYNQQRGPGGDAFLFPLQAFDPATREMAVLEQAILVKAPDRTYGVDAPPEREWTWKGVGRHVPIP